MKTLRLNLLIILISMTAVMQAQDDKKPKVDEMHARKWQFIVCKAKLTSQEVAKIQPIFMEFEEANWKLMDQNREFFKKFKDAKNAKDDQNTNYQEMNDRMINIEMQKAQLLKNYYSKLKKVASAETIFRYFNAERAFRKELIKDFQGGHRLSEPEKP